MYIEPTKDQELIEEQVVTKIEFNEIESELPSESIFIKFDKYGAEDETDSNEKPTAYNWPSFEEKVDFTHNLSSQSKLKLFTILHRFGYKFKDSVTFELIEYSQTFVPLKYRPCGI